jgi:hypothetical protein
MSQVQKRNTHRGKEKLVGDNPNAPFCAYGDDSKYKVILVYAYATFNRVHVERAIRRFNQAKRFYNIPESVQVHCRQLFSGKQRDKLSLGHLNTGNIKIFISRVIEKMNTTPCLVKYGFCNLDEHVTYDEMYPDDTEMHMSDDPKAILGLLANVCFLPNQGLHAEDFEIFNSKDSTKIPFTNHKRIQAGRIRIGGNQYTRDEKPSKLAPHSLEIDHPLQQVADIYAYTIAHALSKNCNDSFFKEQFGKIKISQSSDLTCRKEFAEKYKTKI